MKEGMHYAEEYDNGATSIAKWYTGIDSSRDPNTLIMDYVKIADNLEKIDFFGGEPVEAHNYLEHLADTGHPKNTIVLFH